MDHGGDKMVTQPSILQAFRMRSAYRPPGETREHKVSTCRAFIVMDPLLWLELLLNPFATHDTSRPREMSDVGG
jgi:hypothetical protein